MSMNIRRVVWAYNSGGFEAELVVDQNERSRTIHGGTYDTKERAYHATHRLADELILTLIEAGLSSISLEERVSFHDLRHTETK